MQNSKIYKYTILSIILFLIIAIGYVVLTFNAPCPEPNRKKLIPKSAKWIGGCDGGKWVEFVSRNDSLFRLRFYNYQGKLVDPSLQIDAYFRLKGSSNFPKEFPYDSILNYIQYYGGITVEIRAKNFETSNKYFYLEKVYPLLSGFEKEVYDFNEFKKK